MKRIVQMRIYKGEKLYVAECLDLPVVSHGKTIEEAARNIRDAIDLHLEGENLEDWDILPEFSILANFEIEPAHAPA